MTLPGRRRWRIRAIRGGKWFRERGQKGLSLLPHLFTLANLTCGVFSIIMTLSGNYALAAWLVGGSLLSDGLDGRVARLVRADGEFGKELDSLADVVSFGTAPAILAYQFSLSGLGPWGWAVAALFPICGALRLARFNIIKTSGFFIGTPITAAGTMLAAIMLREVQLNETGGLLVPLMMLILAYLMVSSIPYPDFKRVRGTRWQGHLLNWAVPVGVGAWMLLKDPTTFLIVPLAVYATVGPWTFLLKKVSEQAARVREANR